MATMRVLALLALAAAAAADFRVARSLGSHMVLQQAPAQVRARRGGIDERGEQGVRAVATHPDYLKKKKEEGK